jgi:hypothetical protein
MSTMFRASFLGSMETRLLVSHCWLSFCSSNGVIALGVWVMSEIVFPGHVLSVLSI